MDRFKIWEKNAESGRWESDKSHKSAGEKGMESAVCGKMGEWRVVIVSTLHLTIAMHEAKRTLCKIGRFNHRCTKCAGNCADSLGTSASAVTPLPLRLQFRLSSAQLAHIKNIGLEIDIAVIIILKNQNANVSVEKDMFTLFGMLLKKVNILLLNVNTLSIYKVTAQNIAKNLKFYSFYIRMEKLVASPFVFGCY